MALLAEDSDVTVPIDNIKRAQPMEEYVVAKTSAVGASTPEVQVVQPTPDPTPKPKVIAATLGAASASIVLWLISLAGINIPELVVGSTVTIATFLFGYITSDR